jgi:hypothetical protein
MDATITITGSTIFFMSVAAGAGFAIGYVPLKTFIELMLANRRTVP